MNEEEGVDHNTLRSHRYDKNERRDAASVLDGRRPFAGCHRGLRRGQDVAHRCTQLDERRGVARKGDSFSVDSRSLSTVVLCQLSSIDCRRST
jgi:hypothetical protein